MRRLIKPTTIKRSPSRTGGNADLPLRPAFDELYVRHHGGKGCWEHKAVREDTYLAAAGFIIADEHGEAGLFYVIFIS